MVAIRFSVNGKDENRPLSFGVSGIYTPQQYAWSGTTISGWGSAADWKFPLLPHTELSGEVFVGKGLDALWKSLVPFLQSQDYLNYYESGAPAALAGITMFGGWSQLKVKLNTRNEFNVAIGTGGRNASDLSYLVPNYPMLANISPRNDTLFVNYIFRPKSDLIFSPEFRRLRTYQLSGSPAHADQIGLAAGFLF